MLALNKILLVFNILFLLSFCTFRLIKYYLESPIITFISKNHQTGNINDCERGIKSYHLFYQSQVLSKFATKTGRTSPLKKMRSEVNMLIPLPML
jgi:hypothetical protein